MSPRAVRSRYWRRERGVSRQKAAKGGESLGTEPSESSGTQRKPRHRTARTGTAARAVLGRPPVAAPGTAARPSRLAAGSSGASVERHGENKRWKHSYVQDIKLYMLCQRLCFDLVKKKKITYWDKNFSYVSQKKKKKTPQTKTIYNEKHNQKTTVSG